MQMTRTLILLVLALLIIILGIWYVGKRESYKEDVIPESSIDDASAVRDVVTKFGTKLQMVSLLAPTEVRQGTMEKYYSEYVAPELLITWLPEGAEALGRYASSPWPDHIKIQNVRLAGNEYIVDADVIEMTNTDGGTEIAATYPIALTLQKREGKWMITSMEKGAYSEIPHRQTIVGYWECLPVADTSTEHTLECAIGIAVDQSDGHFAVNTALMSQYPVDLPMGTKVRVSGVITPANQLSSTQKYDIDGIINATVIEKI